MQPADMTSRVVVMSFAPTALRRVKLLAPDIPTVLLMEWRLPGLRDGLLPAGVPIAGPGLNILRADPEFVQRAHERGNQVFVWTVNEPDEVDFVRRLGVDTIITDRPRRGPRAARSPGEPELMLGIPVTTDTRWFRRLAWSGTPVITGPRPVAHVDALERRAA